MKKSTRKTTKTKYTPKSLAKSKYLAKALLGDVRDDVKSSLEFVERLDHEFDDDGLGPEASLYQALYREALEEETRRIASNQRHSDAPTILQLITHAGAFVEPVDAIRRAGFVQAYEFMRQMLMLEHMRGPKLAGGAR